jgi:hypothetical protein
MEVNQSNRSSHFAEWFRQWGGDLWAVIHFGSLSGDEYRDDFVDVAQLSRSRISRRLSPKNGLEGHTPSALQEEAARLFLRDWLRRQKRNRATLLKSDLDWESKLLLCGAFALHWDLEQIARLGGLPSASVRYRTLQALKRFARITDAEDRRPTRDCIRHDLYYVDMVLKTPWKDPLGLFGPAQLLEHRAECARCQHLDQRLGEAIARMKNGRTPTLPSEVINWVQGDTASPSRILSPSWVGSLPWYLKAPLQVGVAAAVLAAVLAVPYAGDFFPKLKFWEHEREDVAVAPPVAKRPV